MGNHIGWSRSRNRSSDYDDDEDLDHNKTGNSSASGSSGASGGSGLKRKYRSSGGHMSSSNLSSNDEPFDEELNTTLSMLLSASGASGSPLSKSKSASLYNRVSNFKMTHRYGDKTASAATGASADLLTPQRKKMKSTSAYIYNTLFKNGENSDIVVRALSREYHLHKLYLCQSPYFDSMFKGSKWKESNQSHIEIAIPDQNINERALDITFGSFYSVEVDIMPVEAVNVLACASLFSLDGLIEQCQSVMLENINAHTVCSYYDASIIYGVSDVANKCLKWFSNNIIINQDLRLGEISPQLFERIVTSPNLMIIRVETDLYSLCKRWLYFQLNKVVAKLEAKSWQKVTNDFFKELIRTLDAAESSSTDNTSLERQSTNRVERFCLLDHPTFAKYLSVFRKIRIKNILGDLDSLKLLYNDRIIPIRWIEPFYYKNWLNLLFVDQDHLSSEYVVEKADFDNECIRFGRILDNDSFYNWRWVGFNFGIDLILSHANRNLTLKRNTLNSNTQSPYKGLLSNKATIRIYYLVKVVELDKQGNEVWSQQTDLTCLDLHKNDEKHLLTIGSRVNYPLILNMHVTSHPFNLNYFNLDDESAAATTISSSSSSSNSS